MTYKSAAAVEMAVKSAASASSLDTARAVSSFYFHRLLCRVFAGNNKKFVLKGWQAMADKFSVPREWGLSQVRQFEKLSANTGLHERGGLCGHCLILPRETLDMLPLLRLQLQVYRGVSSLR